MLIFLRFAIAWTMNGDGSGVVMFVKGGQQNIIDTYGVDGMTAGQLLAYAGGYLMNPQSISIDIVHSRFYAQWANSTFQSKITMSERRKRAFKNTSI